MKKLLIVFCLLLLLGVAVEASAQEVLKGKIPVATATCQVDGKYTMGKDKPNTRPCILFSDGDEDRGWVLIFDQYSDPAAVVELEPDKGVDGQRIVWRKGQVSL